MNLFDFFSANDESFLKETGLYGTFSFDGKLKNCNFRPISFSTGLHLCIDPQYPLRWEVESAKEKIKKEIFMSTRDRWYQRYIILCIPKHSQLELFTSKEMWYETLCFIQDEIDISSPKFKSSIKTVIEKAWSSDFFKSSRKHDYTVNERFIEQEEQELWYPDDENLLKMTQLLITADDIELTKLFLRKFYAKRVDYEDLFVDIMPKSSEQALVKLLKYFQWKDLKGIIEDIILHTQIEDLHRWIDISSDSDINEITDKVIEKCLEKLPEFHEISTASITSYPNGSEPYLPLWTKIFQKVFTSEYFSNLWWEKLSTCDQIISNIDLMVKFSAELPPDCRPKYSIISQYLTKCLKKNMNLETYTPILYLAIKPLFTDTVTYKNELLDIFNELLHKNNSKLVGMILILIAKRDNAFSETEVFKMVLDNYMNWLLIIDLKEPYVAIESQIKLIVEMIYVHGVVIENPEKLFNLCVRIKDMVEFCGLIDKLFTVLPKDQTKSHCKFMTKLVEVIYRALPQATYDDIAELSLVLTALFERGDSYHYILSQMLSTDAVTDDDDTMGFILWSLLRDHDTDFQKLKANTNFRSLLVNYALFLQDPQYPEPDMEPDHSYYRTVIKFLLTHHDFPLALELLPALLQTPFYKKNWKKFFKLMSQVTLQTTENCKMLLRLAVEIFEVVLEEEKRVGKLSSVRYKVILHVYETVFKDDFVNM